LHRLADINRRIYTIKRTIIFLTIILFPIVSFATSPGKVFAAGVSLESSSGSVGSTIQISGNNFTGQYANIYWDSTLVATEIPISTEGNFNYGLAIPASPAGAHTIHITDDSNWSGSTASIEFQINPHITVFPTTCREWTQVDIKGTGFRSYEKAIKILWDDTETLNPPVTADKFGTWTTSFLVPSNSQGIHILSAFGNATKIEEVNKVDMIVAPWVIAAPTTGPVGTQIVIKGWGFRVNEDGITITWDNKIIATNIRAEVDGSILLDGALRTEGAASHDNVNRKAIYVPPSPRGQHVLGVYGSSFTPKGVLPDTYFDVTSHLAVDHASSYEGSEITVSGTGFAVAESITLNFDKSTLSSDIVTDKTGSFTVLITVPESSVTNHTISANGSMGNSAQSEFTSIAKEAPLASPLLKHPSDGFTIAIFNSAGKVIVSSFKYLFGIFSYLGGSFTAPQNVSAVFDWSDVDIAVDGKYVFQIAPNGDFSSPVITREIAHLSEYTLTRDDVITKGHYSWRVQAVDTDGNTSPWSEASTFRIISMPVRVMVLTSIILVLVLAAVVFGILLIYSRISYH
jgi:hypothetical protein